jgi:hypothetical protein
MSMLAVRSKGKIMHSIKNAEAVHGLGRERFSDIPEIVDSPDAQAMCIVMWRICDGDLKDDHPEQTRLRVLSFLLGHDLKRPR